MTNFTKQFQENDTWYWNQIWENSARYKTSLQIQTTQCQRWFSSKAVQPSRMRCASWPCIFLNAFPLLSFILPTLHKIQLFAQSSAPVLKMARILLLLVTGTHPGEFPSWTDTLPQIIHQQRSVVPLAGLSGSVSLTSCSSEQLTHLCYMPYMLSGGNCSGNGVCLALLESACCPVPKLRDCLHGLLDNGKSLSMVKVVAISSQHNTMGGTSLSSYKIASAFLNWARVLHPPCSPNSPICQYVGIVENEP